ncbi:MAG: zf-HC2 domain-containing protein [Planctomycetaceae bacterium]|nr:zf-HC2 domain-containing protein [Planctomycetaceae bacterium]
MVLLAVTTGFLLVPQQEQLVLKPGERNCGGITCTEIHEAAAEFIAGHLQPAVAEKIETHLTQCKRCRDYIDEQRHQHASTEWDEIHPVAHAHAPRHTVWDWTSTALLSVLAR